MDEMAAWATSNPQRFAPVVIDTPDPRPPVRFVPSFLPVSCSRALARRRLMKPDEDGIRYVSLNLGCTTAEVGFVLLDGQVIVQGATVNGGWVDIDAFSDRTKKTWIQDIERELA